jgi:hypothetical protein
VDDNEGEEEGEGDTAPERYPKGVEVGVKFEWLLFW